MANEPIKSLFANDIHRRIEEVIKVDQTSDDILRDEINEYVVTDAIRSHYTNIFDAYREDSEQAARGHRRSGCRASSALANPASQRCLGLSIENRPVSGIAKWITVDDTGARHKAATASARRSATPLSPGSAPPRARAAQLPRSAARRPWRLCHQCRGIGLYAPRVPLPGR